eukprot:TRINITY_DN6679_c0_g1_i2.p1 TRINITY_DN6679_c0_g1~~TRINITY_DN6679_c0_g1_i2.p1  ORF type:complete len:249 (+),score=52.87 TRINITY_DN6679_c0_g1_i2:39-785(+)
MEEQLKVRLSKLTGNKLPEEDDSYDYGENDGLDTRFSDEEGEEVQIIREKITLANNKEVLIEQKHNKLYTGGFIWDSCRALCNFLQECDEKEDLLAGKNCIELGSGSGLGGIALSIIDPSCRVTLTDIKTALPLLHRNVALNHISNVSVKLLDWGNVQRSQWENSSYDIIIASDCIYNTYYHKALCNVLNMLSTPSTRSYIAYGHRGKHQDLFIDLLNEEGFSSELVHNTITHGTEVSIVLVKKIACI